MYYPALSPDANLAAVEAMESGNLDIWVQDVARGARTRLSASAAIEILPVWSPDGTEVAYGSYRAGNIDIFARKADAGTEEKALTKAVHDERVSDWSRDGRHILYSVRHPQTGLDLWRLERNTKGDWEPHPFLQTASNETTPKFSQDGRYVAYLSDESGRREVYVRPFAEGSAKWVVSNGGATQLRWSRSGRELFYTQGGALFSVSVRTVPRLSVAPATRLFAHSAFTSTIDANYDVTADGQRFLVPERSGAHGGERMIRVVQNWLAEFHGQRP
jgi:serine/threonine-protein kinase